MPLLRELALWFAGLVSVGLPSATAGPALQVSQGRLERGDVLPWQSVSAALRAVTDTPGPAGAMLRFQLSGPSPEQRTLASGGRYHQVALKLRAQDACNLLYVVWARQRQPALQVLLKRNPGQQRSAECGARGYRRLVSRLQRVPPALVYGKAHSLRAELGASRLRVYLDGELAWEGALPDDTPKVDTVGLRSDNVAFAFALTPLAMLVE